MSAPGPGTGGCESISADLHVFAELLTTRLQPWLERMTRDGAQGKVSGPSGSPCTCWPLCALLAALRGDRPDVVARLADHTTGLVAAARELLTLPGEPDRAERAASARVQHITVRPAAGDEGGAARC